MIHFKGNIGISFSRKSNFVNIFFISILIYKFLYPFSYTSFRIASFYFDRTVDILSPRKRYPLNRRFSVFELPLLHIHAARRRFGRSVQALPHKSSYLFAKPAVYEYVPGRYMKIRTTQLLFIKRNMPVITSVSQQNFILFNACCSHIVIKRLTNFRS